MTDNSDLHVEVVDDEIVVSLPEPAARLMPFVLYSIKEIELRERLLAAQRHVWPGMPQ
jgi:hypothetical protein